ncbi:MAG: sel1 repeat family protein, partial [Psychrosphaera sp.]|nr:sel1 repeat family protein [Psychrosphaera sp.]
STREYIGKDNKKAIFWLNKAADQELAVAQYELGVMYDNGEGVKEDDIHAITWYRKAANQGYAPAQNNLSWNLATNQNALLRNGEEAVAWAKKTTKGTGANDYQNLDTLAAAYAEVGDFKKAVKTQVQAIKLLGIDIKNKTDDPKIYHKRLVLYKKGKPFRE